jgi:hypothetical protein
MPSCNIQRVGMKQLQVEESDGHIRDKGDHAICRQSFGGYSRIPTNKAYLLCSGSHVNEKKGETATNWSVFIFYLKKCKRTVFYVLFILDYNTLDEQASTGILEICMNIVLQYFYNDKFNQFCFLIKSLLPFLN